MGGRDQARPRMRLTAVLVAGIVISCVGAISGVTARAASSPHQQAELTPSDGTNTEVFGYSTAVSGDTAIVGARFKNNQAGAAYVFIRSGSGWTQQAELTGSATAAFERFGSSVALADDGDMALVGAPNQSTGAGAAYVFTRSGSTWSERAELTASDTGGGFGWSVALPDDGHSALVGAPFHNGDVGAAYVFTRSRSTWSQAG